MSAPLWYLVVVYLAAGLTVFLARAEDGQFARDGLLVILLWFVLELVAWPIALANLIVRFVMRGVKP